MAAKKEIDPDFYADEAVTAAMLALPRKHPARRVIVAALRGLVAINAGRPVTESDLDELYAAFDVIATLAMERSDGVGHAGDGKISETGP